MKKLALILAVLMLAALCIVPAAAGDGDNVIGYSSSRVEKPATVADAHNILVYNYFYDSEYFYINDAAGLVEFSRIVKDEFQNFKGKTIYITKDIDMTGVVWEPIGVDFNAKAFQGTLDGLGHVIDNLVYTSSESLTGNDVTAGGLFAYARGATFKNLVLGSGCSFTYTGTTTDSRFGAFVGTTFGVVDSKSLTFDNCYNLATVSSTGKYTSAFVGQYYNENQAGVLTITNCTNAGNITGRQVVSGFISYPAGPFVMDNCRNTGNITLNDDGKDGTDWGFAAGGFVGRGKSYTSYNVNVTSTIKNSVNNGKVSASGIAGGIAGTVEYPEFVVQKCTNYGSVTATENSQTASKYVGTATDAQVTECLEQAGQATDDTLSTLEQIVFSTTNDDTPVNDDYLYLEDDNKDDDNSEEPKEPSGSETPKTEETPTESDTEATSDVAEETEEEDKKGCKSTVGVGLMSVMTIVCGAAIVSKKKR